MVQDYKRPEDQEYDNVSPEERQFYAEHHQRVSPLTQ